MKYMLILNADEQTEQATGAPSNDDLERDGRVQRGADQGRRAARRRGTAPELRGRARRIRRRRARRASTARSPRRRNSSPASGSSRRRRKEEALEWARRIPLTSGRVEVRRSSTSRSSTRTTSTSRRKCSGARARRSAHGLSDGDETARMTATTAGASARVRRGPARRRGGVAHRVGQADRRARPPGRRRRASPRSSRRMRWSPPSSSGRDTGIPRNAGRLADHGREAPRDRRLATAGAPRRPVRRSSRTTWRQELGADDPARAVEEAIDDDLLRLVFVACHPVLTQAVAGRPHAQAARRPLDRGDRPGVPRPGLDDRPAHRARQAHPHAPPGCRSRCPTAPSSPRGWARCSRSST